MPCNACQGIYQYQALIWQQGSTPAILVLKLTDLTALAPLNVCLGYHSCSCKHQGVTSMSLPTSSPDVPPQEINLPTNCHGQLRAEETRAETSITFELRQSITEAGGIHKCVFIGSTTLATAGAKAKCILLTSLLSARVTST